MAGRRTDVSGPQQQPAAASPGTPVDATRCPLCGGANACALAKGPPCGDCWCSDVVIPPDVLARVPSHLLGRACLCARCVGAGPTPDRSPPADTGI